MILAAASTAAGSPVMIRLLLRVSSSTFTAWACEPRLFSTRLEISEATAVFSRMMRVSSLALFWPAGSSCRMMASTRVISRSAPLTMMRLFLASVIRVAGPPGGSLVPLICSWYSCCTRGVSSAAVRLCNSTLRNWRLTAEVVVASNCWMRVRTRWMSESVAKTMICLPEASGMSFGSSWGLLGCSPSWLIIWPARVMSSAGDLPLTGITAICRFWRSGATSTTARIASISFLCSSVAVTSNRLLALSGTTEGLG